MPTGDDEHQQQPETRKNGTASGGDGETFWTDDGSSRLPDMTVVKSRPGVVASRAPTERPPRWRGGGGGRQQLLQRGGRQAPESSMEPSSSSSRIVHGDVICFCGRWGEGMPRMALVVPLYMEDMVYI